MKFLAHKAAAFVAFCLLPGCASGHDGKSTMGVQVSKLVDQTTKSGRLESKAFKQLESLGKQAVPYIVGHLGDTRPLAENEISLENKASDAFEGVRHYAPSTVHDALAAILNQITGQSFVIVYNGAAPQEREENRRRWIEWCRLAYPDQAEICNGK